MELFDRFDMGAGEHMEKQKVYSNLAEHSKSPDLKLISSEETGQAKTCRVEEAEEFSGIKQKYKNQMILEVGWADQILHVKLSNRLGVSPSGLNATIKKNTDVGFHPLRERKNGKFKFYSLSEEGGRYLESEVLPLFIDSDSDEEEARAVFDLLTAYKDENQWTWNENLQKLLENQSEASEDESIGDALGHEFIRQYVRFYCRDARKAECLLNLLIADKKLTQKIIANAQIQQANRKQSVMHMINEWEEQDCEETYRIMDRLFRDVATGKQMQEVSDTSLQDAQERLEMVQNKLMSDVLRALISGWNKDRMKQEWIQAGMEKHLALYLAEQYRILCNNISEKESEE